MKIELYKSVDKNLTIKLIEYCLKTEKVTLNSLIGGMNLNSEEAEFVRTHMVSWDKNTGPNHILAKASGDVRFTETAQLHLLPNALFSYVDHVEIIDARKASAEAKRLSLHAIWISMVSLIIGSIIGGLQLYFQLNLDG
jgi:hypothetical protein